jgi:cysteine desulfurase
MPAYFDHNATTPLDPAVLEAMLPFLSGEYGNASSIHKPGQRARAAVEQARAQVATLIGADPEEIVFTSGGTESDNLAILGASAAAARKRHAITTSIEHHAVLHCFRALERQDRAWDVSYLPCSPEGLVSTEALREALRPQTALVSVMHANNEIGTVQPIAEMAAAAHESGAAFHTDAVQSAGKIPVDVSALGVDLLSLSAHKFYGPKGVGALYVRRGVAIQPLLHGGHNFGELRPGTENVAGIVGLGAAAELARIHMREDTEKITQLRDYFEWELRGALSPAVLVANFPEQTDARAPNTSNFSFHGVDGEALVIALDLAGFACSTGSACSSGTVEPSHVLLALGRSPKLARSGLRVSFGRHNTREQVDGLVRAVVDAVSRLRALSPEVAGVAN